MSYSELLRNPLWQKKRLQIFERDNWTCTKCTDQFTNLQVHHFYYLPDALPWEYPDTALTTYCELCHLKVEFFKWLFKVIDTALVRLKFNDADIESVKSLIVRKVNENHHKQSAIEYMDNIKLLINGQGSAL